MRALNGTRFGAPRFAEARSWHSLFQNQLWAGRGLTRLEWHAFWAPRFSAGGCGHSLFRINFGRAGGPKRALDGTRFWAPPLAGQVTLSTHFLISI